MTDEITDEALKELERGILEIFRTSTPAKKREILATIVHILAELVLAL